MNSQWKTIRNLFIVLGISVLFLTGCVTKEAPKAAYDPGRIPTVDVEFDPAQVPNPFHTIVGIDFVKPFVCDNLLRIEPREDVVLIDSRPKRPRYDRGHIPTAISMPDSQFDELIHKLPADKSALLIFHCQNFA
ncbi:rhodanese-like domain-containing protein [Desulfonatronovibrio magnus]|uniref:rhodanese-like domain-containing protein n=1 Tax=Desulfonatronovibrio magnus TaxID=698827 RepID=UPI0005EBEEC9|nr:rhodanese-like domain-containing protein [Desulfonatronovibrio magnus]